jgi:arylsulfatase A-like enzyme
MGVDVLVALYAFDRPRQPQRHPLPPAGGGYHTLARQRQAAPSERFLPEVLRDAGLRTAQFGKLD